MTIVQKCFDGEHTPVACGTSMVDDVNAELARLSGNDDFLYSLLKITRLGQALFICDAPVIGVSLGEPVYYDEATKAYKPAFIAFTENDGELSLSPSSNVVGLVTNYIDGASTATIVIVGITGVDLTESTGFSAPSGLYYLTRTAGKLSLEPDPAVSLAVLFGKGDGDVVFRPEWPTPQSLYRLRQFDLEPGPAGNYVVSNSQVEITGGGDATKRGWLPADADSFDGLDVPVGAVLGYNLDAHIELKELWPPIPLSLIRLDWQVEGNGRGGAGDVSPDLVVFNEDGIWWMSGCIDQVPWTNTGDNSLCGDRVAARLQLFFPTGIPNDLTRVTSLKSRSPNLKLYREGTNDLATSGALEIDANFNLLLGSVLNDDSALALKGFDNDGLLKRGPIVGRVKSLSPELVVSGGTVDANGYQYGNLTLSLGGPQRAELLPQRIALDGATTDESYGLSLAIGFPPNANSSIRSQFIIPSLTESDFFLVQYEVWIAAGAAGILPELSVNSRAWKRPAQNAIAVSPTEDLAIDFTVPSTSLAINNYVEVISDTFAVQSGSMLSVGLSRSVTAGDRSSIEARIIKQVLRLIKPDSGDEVTNPGDNPPSGVYSTEYANQYG